MMMQQSYDNNNNNSNLKIVADQNRIFQVICNLVNNAINLQMKEPLALRLRRQEMVIEVRKLLLV